MSFIKKPGFSPPRDHVIKTKRDRPSKERAIAFRCKYQAMR